jgi:hypothetical protein
MLKLVGRCGRSWPRTQYPRVRGFFDARAGELARELALHWARRHFFVAANNLRPA